MLAVPDGFDDPVIVAVFDDPPVEVVAEGAAEPESKEVSAGAGVAEAEAVSSDTDVSLLSCPYEAQVIVLWPLPWRRCIKPSTFRTEGGQGHADVNDAQRRKVAIICERIVRSGPKNERKEDLNGSP